MTTIKIIVDEYSDEWSILFNQFKSVYESYLLNDFVAIHHVGSTSVPGLAAKPILDIDIEINDQTKFEKVKIELEKLGYKHVGDLGIKQREAFKPTATLSDELPNYNHNLYVCCSGNIAMLNHITFRDALIQDESLVSEYSQLKRDLALKFKYDIDAYIEGKTAFITKVLADAGFDNSTLEDIEEQNRVK